MNPGSKPIRIALLVDRPRPGCPEESLLLPLEGLPPLRIRRFLLEPGVQPPPTLSALGFEPGRFDLILDGADLRQHIPDFPASPANLLAGPAAQALAELLCQLEELRSRDEINSGIIESATDAIVTINEDHIIVGYNRGAEQIFGYKREEALGQDLKIIIPQPYKEAHRDYVRRFIATREARVIGKHVRLNAERRDGREFPISISFSVAEVRGNLYFTGIVRDITEYKEMEDRLVQSERLAAIGNTVTHIAHEIKNPLLIIGGFARQLQRLPSLDDKSKNKLTIIAEEVTRLEEMVAEMRDFLKRPEPQKTPGQVENLVNETLELFRDAFAERQIKVSRSLEGPLPPVSFDAKQLREVLINLYRNALEAMPRGGELTVAVRVVHASHLEIAITDTGEGMTPEVAANIFQPYFTTKAKGTGLGLAICQSIIQEHGGQIRVESASGQGSTFTIQLPLTEEASGA